VEHFERYGVIEDRGGELVQVRNLVNDDTFWTKRSRLKRYDGCWVMLTDRAVELLNAARKRQVAKAAKKSFTKLPEAEVTEAEIVAGVR
jgi:hypothetical protein